MKKAKELDNGGVAITPLLNMDILDGLTKNEKIELIEDALHRLNFEKRWTQLTDAQLIHMDNSPLSIEQLEKINNCKTDEAREVIINDHARAEYFRQCAWIDYLNGEINEPPFKDSEEL